MHFSTRKFGKFVGVWQKSKTYTQKIDAEERIQIEITNNGSAIPAEVAENIFPPFFTTKTDGSGIGLAFHLHITILQVVIVTLHIWLVSVPHGNRHKYHHHNTCDKEYYD
ncbi:MAG: hypothetical protein IJB87_02975 [Alistipes sp.]|nr:hypothetical protein [Alistipes sp.]